MTPQEHQQLNDIIEELEIVQGQAPVKTVYSMGRADHSISHQLLDVIRHLKALAHEPASEPDTEPVAITDIDGNTRETIDIPAHDSA